MSKKDYILIANVIKNSSLAQSDKENIAFDFAHILSVNNERFDPEMFIAAASS